MTAKPLRPGLVIFATLLGNTLEWFEYLSFAFLIPVFATNFFPEDDPLKSLFRTLFGFSLGYILRPIGALVFGYLGDKYGRKLAFFVSIAAMSLPTLIIGLLPTYAQIGYASVIFLILMRLFQGIVTGGELPCSMVFLVESAPPSLRCLYGSTAYVGMTLGILIGSADLLILNHYFPSSLANWGWRVIYLFGASLGLLALWLRSKLHETHPFKGLKETHEVIKDPALTVIKKYKLKIFKIFWLQMLQTINLNLLISFSVVYYTKILNLPDLEATKLNIVFLVLYLSSLLVSGWMGKYISPKKIMVSAAIGHLVLSLPLYWILQVDGMRTIALICFGILGGFYAGPSIVFFCKIFPTKVRLSGLALGLNLSIAIFGGFTPLLALFIIQHTQYLASPAVFLMLSALIALIVLATDRDEQLRTIC